MRTPATLGTEIRRGGAPPLTCVRNMGESSSLAKYMAAPAAAAAAITAALPPCLYLPIRSARVAASSPAPRGPNLAAACGLLRPAPP